MQTKQYLSFAIKIAKQNGALFKKYFGNVGKIKIKNHDFRNQVTKTDLQIEKNVRKAIAKTYPAHKIIGEEFKQPLTQKNDLVWIIDPIDGTTNYIQGIPLCCISIALWDKDGPLVGVLFNPVTNEMFSAGRKNGAFLNNKKIRVSQTSKLLSSLGGIGWLKPLEGIKITKNILPFCRKVRVLATSAWQIGMVAQGSLDFYATCDINIWDFAAAACILQEAGGSLVDFKNKPITLHTKTIIASNKKLQNELFKNLSQNDLSPKK